MTSISIGYLASQLGSDKISCSDFDSEFPDWNMKEVISKTGVNYIYQSNESETVEELSFKSCKKITILSMP